MRLTSKNPDRYSKMYLPAVTRATESKIANYNCKNPNRYSKSYDKGTKSKIANYTCCPETAEASALLAVPDQISCQALTL